MSDGGGGGGGGARSSNAHSEGASSSSNTFSMYVSSPLFSPREPWKPPAEKEKLVVWLAASKVAEPTVYIHEAQCPGRHVCTTAPTGLA